LSDLKQRLNGGELVIGTWVKTPQPIIVEVLGLSELDCMVLDAEHAPFDRSSMDACLAVQGRVPVLVRTPTSSPEHVLQALDSGAAGVVVPHIRSAEEARQLVQSTRYAPGGRGYAGSSRAAGYGTKGMERHRREARDVVVIAQIEDVSAVESIEAIAAVEGIDALFIGRADLTVALGAESPDDPAVVAAVERICAAGVAAGRRVGMFLPRPADAPQWQEKGATLFLLQSDHDFLRAGANALAAAVRHRDSGR
jgi:2-keto-3-deoxy-L-rhamnonate aldolase RhmA